MFMPLSFLARTDTLLVLACTLFLASCAQSKNVVVDALEIYQEGDKEKAIQVLARVDEKNDYVVNNNLAAFYLGRHFPDINKEDALNALEVLERIKYDENSYDEYSNALVKYHVSLMRIVANQALHNESEVQKELMVLCPVEQQYQKGCVKVIFKALSDNLVMAGPNRSEIEESYFLGLAGYRIDPDIFYLQSMVIAMSKLNIDEGYHVLTRSRELPEFSDALVDSFCGEMKYQIDTRPKSSAGKYKKMCNL